MANRFRSGIDKQALVSRRLRKAKRGINMRVFQNFNEDDVVESDVAKGITSAMFTNDADSTLTSFYTSSDQVASAGGKYQFEVYSTNPATDATATPQFSIAYGNIDGAGAVTSSGASDASMSPAKAIYTQFANLLLEPGDDKFTIDGDDETDMMFITFNRARYKEKANKGNWDIDLENGADTISLIDNSSTVPAMAKNGKKVYSVVSGSGTTIASSPQHTEYGLFYPELGIIALSVDKMDDTSGLNGYFPAPVLDVDAAMKTNMITALSSFKARAEEDISSTHYFIRVKNSEYNFTNNNTFVTGSGNLKHVEMINDPQTYITTVGLYSDENELVAVAKLSKPLLKNFTREATIRVKLDY